jgi:hypothetical protein
MAYVAVNLSVCPLRRANLGPPAFGTTIPTGFCPSLLVDLLRAQILDYTPVTFRSLSGNVSGRAGSKVPGKDNDAESP